MEMITQDVIKQWWDQGKNEHPTHMIVVSDTFDYEYYPVYVQAAQQSDVLNKVTQINQTRFLSVQEVYAYFLPFTFQVNEARAYFTETNPEIDPTSHINSTRSSS